MTAITLLDVSTPVALTIIASLLAVSSWMTFLVGGGTVVAPLWFFVPIFLAGLRFGPLGALVAGMVTTVLTGPILPARVDTGVAQATSFWLSRGIFFILVGQFVTQLFAGVRRISSRESTLALEVALGSVELELKEAARTEAERANAAKSEFLSRMSHELRTPLNAILGFSQLLSMDELNEDQDEAVHQISKGGRHLLNLINEVLDISRVESGKMAISLEQVLVSDVMGEVLDLVAPLTSAHHIEIVPPASGTCDEFVFTDRQRFKQVLMNLISNAIKYNRDEGVVSFRCEPRRGGMFAITVVDSGIGIPPTEMDRLFTPFDRLNAETTDVEGSGVGLALSQALVHAMGGSLEADSILGVGSNFTVVVPLMRVVQTPSAPEGAAGRASQVTKSDDLLPGELTVVYVEDNVANLRLVEQVAARRPGVTLHHATRGRSGLDLIQGLDPDLILLDLHLPDISGEEVLRRVRAGDDTRDTPVVILSADATPHQIERQIEFGANGYLTKPFDIDELLGWFDHARTSGEGR